MRLALPRELNQDTCQPTYFEANVIFHGNEQLRSVLDFQAENAAECCRKCAAVAACTHWTLYSGGTCQLQRGNLASISGNDGSEVLPGMTTVSGRMVPGVRADRLAAPLDAETAALIPPPPPPPNASGGAVLYLDPFILLAQPELMRSLGIDPALLREPAELLASVQGGAARVPAESGGHGDLAGLDSARGPRLPRCEWEPEDAPALESGLVRSP